jgi:hypothetical protein
MVSLRQWLPASPGEGPPLPRWMVEKQKASESAGRLPQLDIIRGKESTWKETGVRVSLEHIDQALQQVEEAELRLANLQNGNGQLGKVLDLFPNTRQRLELIRESLENMRTAKVPEGVM